MSISKLSLLLSLFLSLIEGNYVFSQNPEEILVLYSEPKIGRLLKLSLTSHDFKFIIENEGNTNFTNITLKFSKCERNLLIIHQNNFITNLSLDKLKSGEMVEYDIKFIPLTVGTCNLGISLDAYTESGKKYLSRV